MRVAGEPISFVAEIDNVPANIDHFWITIQMGDAGPLRIALSTHSRQNAAAGFDPRVRVGVIAGERNLPAAGLFPSSGLDYGALETENPVTYVEYERPALEVFLADKTRRSIFIEAWGELYVRNHLGIHQVHSRRASCSVLTNYIGRDGAIRFYYRTGPQKCCSSNIAASLEAQGAALSKPPSFLRHARSPLEYQGGDSNP